MASQRFTVRLGERTYAAERLSGETVRLHSESTADANVAPAGDEPGALRVSINGRSRLVYAAGPPGRRWVFCDGRVFEAEVEVEGRPRSGRRTAHAESLSAPMPATVVRIAVREGQRVTRGETLIMLEAMKMELPIRAASDATVKRIQCREGDLVKPGISLIELE